MTHEQPKTEGMRERFEKLKERLADIEHQRWSHWQRYMHSKIIPSDKDGISEIGTELIERWSRQINTDYSDLSEQEKQSDRNEVEKYFPIIQDFIEQELKKEREEIIALVNGKKVIEPDAYDEPVASDIAVCINSKIDDIINLLNKE